jgi:hypothetical protein
MQWVRPADIISNQRVIILGSAPSVLNVSAEKLETYDIIIRCNNWEYFNNCERTDIWYSFFGGSVNSKPEYNGIIWMRLPNIKFAYKEIEEDFTGFYSFNEEYFAGREIILTPASWYIEHVELIGNNPTTGMQAILDCLKVLDHVTIAGFDFFTSGLHNINEKWEGLRKHTTGRDNHSPSEEKKIIELYEKMGKITWIK